jgi:hypothetical protein
VPGGEQRICVRVEQRSRPRAQLAVGELGHLEDQHGRIDEALVPADP